MRRTEQVQGLRLMKFEEVYGRTHRGGLSQAEAAEVLGVSERTFRRWRDRYEAEGADGLYDRRLGRLSARRAPVDEVARVLELFDTRYWDFTAKHFHEKLVADHGFKRSYNWLRLSLQAHGRRRAAPRRGAHRRKRPRRAMMFSSHEWADGGPMRFFQRYLLGLLRRRRGHVESFQGVSEAGSGPRPSSARSSHFNTPEAGGKIMDWSDRGTCVLFATTQWCGGISAWHFRSPPAATAAIVKARVRVHEYPDGTMAASMDDALAQTRRWPTDRQPNPRGRVTRFDATDRRPWTAAPRPTIPHRARNRNRSGQSQL